MVPVLELVQIDFGNCSELVHAFLIFLHRKFESKLRLDISIGYILMLFFRMFLQCEMTG